MRGEKIDLITRERRQRGFKAEDTRDDPDAPEMMPSHGVTGDRKEVLFFISGWDHPQDATGV